MSYSWWMRMILWSAVAGAILMLPSALHAQKKDNIRASTIVKKLLEAKDAVERHVDPARPAKKLETTKKWMAEVYRANPRTFYCGCTYSGGVPDHKSCGYKPRRKKNPRAFKIEWQHVVPVDVVGRTFESWKKGHPSCRTPKGKKYKGRKCAAKVSSAFRIMEADQWNLVPVIGEVNQRRSNYSFAKISGEKRRFGKCDLEIRNRRVEPRKDIRGDIARIYFYMHGTYQHKGVISRKQWKLFDAWAAADPIDAWECKKYQRITSVVGRGSYVWNKCARPGNRPSR